MEKTIEIPFGAKDSELKGWEYTIPENMEAEIAEIKEGKIRKIIVKQKESDDEKIRKALIDLIGVVDETYLDYYLQMPEPRNKMITYLEKQKEPHYTKRNAFFDKCVENCDPEVMKSVSDEVDEMLEKEQKSLTEQEFCDYNKALHKFKVFATKQAKEHNICYIKDVEWDNFCVGIFSYFYKPTEWSEEDEKIRRFFAELATDACGGSGQEYYEELGLNYDKVMGWLEKQKEHREQKPTECIEFDNEFKNQVSHLLASVLNKEWEYNKGFVEYAAQQLLGYANHEFKPAEWSEDERIRRAIIELFKEFPSDSPIYEGSVYTMKDALAYLEKQKEQKWSPSEGEMGALYKLCYISNQITDEDDTELIRLYQDLKREYFNGHSFENMFLDERQKEQTPIFRVGDTIIAKDVTGIPQEAFYIEKIEDGFYWEKDNTILISNQDEFQLIEKKPAECLKPEIDCWYVCIKDFYGGGKKQSSNGDLVQAKGGMYMMGREDISEWFRKAYYDEIKSVEWSEEDEEILERFLGWLQGTMGEKTYSSWLKSLHDKFKSPAPQPHWKPSEEQMEWLESAVRLSTDKPHIHGIIISLYEQLKRLL